VTSARQSRLDDLGALGPFFAVGSHLPGAALPASWRPGSELAGPSDALGARIAAVRAALAARGGRDIAEVEPRVAGSAAHLGLAARLIAPALGAAVLRCRLDLRPGGLWWRDELGGAMPLSVPASAGSAPAGTGSAGTGSRGVAPAESDGDPEAGGPAPRDLDWARRLIDETIAPVTAAVARLVPVSGRVLWGNVASAANTAAAQVARQRPDLAPDAWRAAGLLLAGPRLRGESGHPGPAFRRSSCCLFYRLAPGDPSALCGDCVLGARRAR
jgi:hypothetical protein